MKRNWRLIIGGILLILVVGIIVVSFPLNEWLVAVKVWLKTLGFWATPAFISVYVLATVIGFPSIFFFLVAGTLFGFLKGTVLVSIADTLSIVACYILVRTIARKRVKGWLEKRPQFTQLDEAVNRKGWKIVFLTRLSPVVPSNLLNYGFSLTKINFWHYLFFSWLGMLPVIALYVYFGSAGANLFKSGNTPQTLTLQVVGLIATAIAVIYTTKLTQKALSKDNKIE